MAAKVIRERNRSKTPTSESNCDDESSLSEQEIALQNVFERNEELKELCSCNGFSDKQFIKGCHIVPSLDMFLGFWRSMRSVQYFTGLKSLAVIQQVTVTRIEGIECCPLLEQLWITECSVDKIENLSKCLNLTKLHLSSNKISKIENLHHLTNLREIWLNDNKIEKIENLENLTKLRQLWLCRNRISRIGSSLDSNLMLTDINLSDNFIGSFKELLNLSRLPKLHSICLSDPHFGDNPVCRLCNFQTFVICQLNQLRVLDTMKLTDETKQIAEATFLRKKMYYNMRIKTLKRNSHNIMRKVKGICQSLIDQHNVSLTVLKQHIKVLNRELDEIEWFGSPKNASCAPKNNIMEWKEKVVKKRNIINRVIQQTLQEIHHTEYHLEILGSRVYSMSKMTAYRLLMELETGGNIRLEDGAPSDAWYVSCVDLIKSRLFMGNFQPLRINSIDVTRVTRIHNRYLRTQFEKNMEHLLLASKQTVESPNSDTGGSSVPDSSNEPSSKKTLEYLFYAEPPCLADLNSNHCVSYGDKMRIAESGFHSAEEFQILNMPESITMMNSISGVLLPQLSMTMHQRGSQNLGKASMDNHVYDELRNFGWNSSSSSSSRSSLGNTLRLTNGIETCKLMMQNGDFHLPYGSVLIGKVFTGDSANFDSEGGKNPPARKHFEESSVQSFCESHPTDPSQKKYFIHDRSLILPEYIVELEYVNDNILNPATCSASPAVKVKSLKEILAMLDSKTIEKDYRTSNLSAQELNDLQPVLNPLVQFVVNTRLFEQSELARSEKNATKIHSIVEMEPFIAPRSSLVDLNESSLLSYYRAADLLSIKYINFNECAVCQMECFNSCENLEVLILSFNHITRIDGVNNLKKLERLDLGFNKIRKIENLQGCKALVSLDLSNNLIYRVEDIQELKVHLPQITDLNLRSNSICDVKGYRPLVLQKLTNLKLLDTRNIHPDDISRAKRLRRALTAEIILHHSRNSSIEAAIHLDAEPNNLESDREKECERVLTTQSVEEKMHDDRFRYIFELEVNHQMIKQLQGLKGLTKLRRASFADNEIMRIDGLQNCTLLEELNLEENRIVELSGLDTLIHLKKLDLGKNRLTSIENIDALVNLTQLSLEDNNITSLKGLSSLVKLMELYIGNNQIVDLKEIQNLKHLQKLIILDLSGNKIYRDENYRLYTIYFLRRIKVLDGCNVSPEELALSKQKYSGKLTIEFLLEKLGNSFDRVQELELSGCRIREIEEINGNRFCHLKELNLDNNLLTEIDGLYNLPALRVLRINNNRIEKLLVDSSAKNDTDLNAGSEEGSSTPPPNTPDTNGNATSGLYACPNLEVLQLSGNHITDMSKLGLHFLSNLKVLYLNGNNIKEVSGLGFNFELRELYLQKNKIKALSPNSVSALANLRSLRLEDNCIRSLSNFKNLYKLQTLNLAGNKISDLEEIDRLTSIPFCVEMNFGHNPVTKKLRYRPTVVYKFPTLRVLDMKEILLEERERVDMFFSQDQCLNNVFPFDMGSQAGSKVTGYGRQQKSTTLKPVGRMEIPLGSKGFENAPTSSSGSSSVTPPPTQTTQDILSSAGNQAMYNYPYQRGSINNKQFSMQNIQQHRSASRNSNSQRNHAGQGQFSSQAKYSEMARLTGRSSPHFSNSKFQASDNREPSRPRRSTISYPASSRHSSKKF